jgi:hypothetical protein
MVKLVGIAGKMGSGKTSLALLIKQQLVLTTGEKWYSAAFGDSLKVLVAKIYGVPSALCYSEHGKSMCPPSGVPKPIEKDDLPYPLSDLTGVQHVNDVLLQESDQNHSLGRLLQITGEAFRTYVDPDYWVKALEFDLDPTLNYVIDDVRYPNEYEWFYRTRVGIVGRVVSTDITTTYCGRDANHKSETALDDCVKWDFELENIKEMTDIALVNEISKKLKPLIFK